MLIKKNIFFILVVAVVTAFSGCSGGGSSSSNSGNTSGSAQKGPFANGSVVKAYELVNGVRSGSKVQTTTHGIKGDFTFNSLPWTNPTQIVVTGYYFDEVIGDYRSDGNLSVVIKGRTGKIDGGVNVNILTKITSARIIKLLKEGKTFDEAYVLANNLIKEMFNLDFPNGKGPESLDLTKTDKPDNAKLLQISAALLSTQNPQQVLENIVDDVKDGNLDGKGDAGVQEIKEKTKTINLQKVAANLDLQVGSQMATHVDKMLQGELPVDFNLKFIDKFDVKPSSQVNSNEVTLLGFDGNVSVEVVNANAIINDGSILHPGNTKSVPIGSTIKLITIASSDYSTKKTATLKVNSKSFYFSTTTKSDPNSSNDTTPNSFNLGKKLNIELSSDVESEEVVVSGLSQNVFVDVNITGGKYSVNGVNKNATVSRVTTGDKIKVKITTASQFSTLKKATLNIGGISKDFITVTRPRDITPTPFNPQTKYNVNLNTSYMTEYFRLDGFEGDLPLVVFNGEVQVEGDSSWNTKINSASRGIRVRFRQTSANDFDRIKITTIKLGNYQTTFKTITKANPALMDYVPTHFNFPTKRIGIADGKTISVESDGVAITGIANGNGINIKPNYAHTQIKINSGNWTNGVITGVKAGDILKVKIPNINNTLSISTTTISYYDNNENKYKGFAAFRVLTHKITQTPNDIDFGSQTNVNSNGTYFSNTVTISGLSQGVEVNATIVGNGAYSKNGSLETVHNTKNIKLKNGDTIQFRLTFLDEPKGTTESMFLNFKNKSFRFSVTTNKAPLFQTTPSFSAVEVGDYISFTPRVIDDSTLTFSLHNTPSWMEINTTTGKISGIVESGTYQDINLTATDSKGLSSSVLFSIVANSTLTLIGSSFGQEFILDDKSSDSTHFTFSFKVSDDQTLAKDLNITTSHEIIDSILPATGLNSGFTNSTLTCDMQGNCGANVAFDFNRTDGLHPVLKTRHYVTVSDGDKNITKYVDVVFEPSVPKLSGSSSLNYKVLAGKTTSFHSYVISFGGVAESWSIQNMPSWVTFDETTKTLTGVMTQAQVGSYHDINITATNHRGSSSYIFDINVVAQKFQIQNFYGVEINKYYDTFITVDWLANGQSVVISSSGYNGQPSHSGFIVNGNNNVTTVQNGDIVRVGHLSSNEYDTELHTTITIGDDSDDFITRTKVSVDTKLPLIVGAPNTSANIHEAYSYIPQMSNDMTKYAPATKPFEIQNKPDWAAFNTGTGELSGTPTAMGVYKNVKIIAHGDNGIDDITFDIMVSNDGPSMHSSNLSLENENLDFTYSDNSDWRSKITEVSMFGCALQSEAIVLDSADYTFSEGALQLHVSSSNNVALHVPTFGGYRLIIKATDYVDNNVYTEMVSDGQYGISATLRATPALTEENLDGAKVQIALNNALKFKDNVLESSNFTLTNSPEATHITNARYIDATHAELTLSYNGVDFDSDTVLSVAINTNELNTPCADITTNTVSVVAIIEKPYINMLYPNDPSEDAKFGYSVVDFNNTVAVGARTGVYIFTKGSDGNYTQTQKIPPLDAGEYFGSALAMDGDYLIIADKHHKESNKSMAGMALVYKKGTDGNYSQVADLTPADNEAYDNFGNAVAISKDLILVGAENALREPDRGGRGKAYLYKNDGNDNFTLIETITRSNGKPFDGFGHDVAIRYGVAGTNEENTSFMLVGSYVLPDYDSSTNTTDTKEELGAGFANYYLYKDGTLSAPVVVSADDSTTLSDHFGSGVALGGNLAVIGSSVRLYSYARGEGNALNARVKIDNAGAGISGGNVSVNFTGYNNKARNVIVAGRKSFVSNEESSAYTAYESRLNDNDDLGYSASLSGFEVARGDYSNSDLVANGGAVLVTNAYENITSTTSSVATPPTISEPEYGYGLATDYVDFAFTADDTWKNSITSVLYKAGANAEYVVLGENDYTITADNNIRLQTAQSTNVALHTPYESHGSLLVKADGYLDDVVTISRVGGGSHAIKAELSSDTALNENNLDGAVIHIALLNTLEFTDATLESVNFRLVGAPTGVNIDTVAYSDATHADVTLAFDGTDFDDNATLGITLNAVELNAYEGVASENTLEVTAVVETVADGVTLQAVDPYITYARFWYDKNSNGQVEDYELSTYSDENGTFSFSTSVDDASLITMVESGLHNGRPYDGNLTLEYNASTAAFISPITTLEQKGFTLDEIRTMLVDAGVSSDLNVSELIMNPMDSALLPVDGNMSNASLADIAKMRRIFIGNAALNAVIAAQDAYGLDKASLQDMLTHVYSMGEGGEGSPTPTSLLAYGVSLGNMILSDGNLKSYNARGEARIYVSMTNLLHEVVQNYIRDNGSLDDGILYELKYNITDNYLNIVEAMTNAYADALAAGVSDPKIEWVYLGDHHRPLWMLSVADMQNIFDKHVFNTIVIKYKDANGDVQNVEFDIDNDYLENSTHLGQWSISNGKVLANSKEIEFRGTKLRIDGVDYDVIDVGSYLPDHSLQNFYEEIPEFSTISTPVDGAKYIDVNSTFMMKVVSNTLSTRLQEHITCSLSQGYNGNVDVNVTFGSSNTIIVIPNEALKHNVPYSLNCGISYGDDYAGKSVGFRSEELYLPLLKTGQTESYDANGQITNDSSIKDDGYYQTGREVLHGDNNGTNTVSDLQTGLEWEDDGQTDTNGASKTAASYGPCEMLDLDGKTDWRAPTALEMMSLFNFQSSSIHGFDNISTSSTGYWTSTKGVDSTAYNSDQYLYVVMPKYTNNTDETNKKMHMCVRIYRESTTDEAEMKKDGDIVIDYKDNLEWSDDADVNIDRTWEDAINSCEESTLGGHSDWRMPNINELVRIVGHSVEPSSDVNQDGYINSTNTVFRATAFGEEFWSSTTDKSDTTKAYYLNGRYGTIFSASKDTTRKSRCVRTK